MERSFFVAFSESKESIAGKWKNTENDLTQLANLFLCPDDLSVQGKNLTEQCTPVLWEQIAEDKSLWTWWQTHWKTKTLLHAAGVKI